MSYNAVDFDRRIDCSNAEANILLLRNSGVITKSAKLLEIGSGRGGLLHFLLQHGFDVTGVEIDQGLIEQANQIFGDLPLHLVTSEVLPFDENSFDVVLSFDVFEHIPDSDKHLKEVHRVLRAGGCYLLETPNKFTNVIFETIRHRSFTRWRKEHCSLHHYWGITRRFKKNSFAVEFYDIPVVNEFFKTKVNRYLGVPGLWLLRLINPDKLALFLRTNFYVKATKRA